MGICYFGCRLFQQAVYYFKSVFISIEDNFIKLVVNKAVFPN